MSLAACRLLHLLQELLPTGPGLVVRFLVGVAGIRRLARSHKAVTRAFVNDGLVSLPRLLHGFGRLRHGGADPRIVATIEAIYRRADPRELLLAVRSRTVEDESGLDVLSVRRKA